ncbi:MAG TPA: hypothetical protein VG365_06605 [Solirubrobacteraceae bacterium]|nr:hypothetical protein [Solirubrobacteraceae bacterium]
MRDLTRALRALLEDDELAHKLRHRGYRHAASFTWESAACAARSVYEDVWPRAAASAAGGACGEWVSLPESPPGAAGVARWSSSADG